MNKQALIAGLIGAASAQAKAATPCDGPFVTKAEARKVELAAAKVALEAATAGLKASADAAKTAFDTAAGRVTAQETLMAGYLTDLTSITALNAAQDKIVTDQQAIITAKTASKATAETALTTAQGLVTTAAALVGTRAVSGGAAATGQQLVVDQKYATVLTTLEAKAQAGKDKDVKDQLKTDADAVVTAWDTKITTLTNAMAVSNTGITAKALAAAGDYTTAQGVTSTAHTAIGTQMTSSYSPAKWAKDFLTIQQGVVDGGCTFSSEDCTQNTGDPIKAIKTTLDATATNIDNNLTTATTTATTGYNAKKTAYVTAKLDELKKLAIKEARDAQKAADETTLTGYGTSKTADQALATNAANNALWAADDLAVATAAYNNAVTDHALEVVEYDRLAALVVPLTADVSVKAYLLKQETDALTAATAAKDAAATLATGYAALKASRQGIVDDYQTQLAFLQCASVGVATATSACKTLTAQSAAGRKAAADALLAANASAIAANALAITAGETALAQAIAACKGLGYDKAMAAKKALVDKTAADAAAAAAVKTAYDAKAAFGTGGAENTPCAYKDVAGSLQRPTCNEGLCCGAAQKFLRDGTKLAVETCQSATGVHVYTYYPPLPVGATAEPTPETWRFQCISGAQKLFAAATAALAASAMMA